MRLTKSIKNGIIFLGSGIFCLLVGTGLSDVTVKEQNVKYSVLFAGLSISCFILRNNLEDTFIRQRNCPQVWLNLYGGNFWHLFNLFNHKIVINKSNRSLNCCFKLNKSRAFGHKWHVTVCICEVRGTSFFVQPSCSC